MYLNEFDDNPEIDIGRYTCNDNFFRRKFTLTDYDALTDYLLDDFDNKQDFDEVIKTLPSVMFIDLRDVCQFIRAENIPGLPIEAIQLVGEIVCDQLGYDSDLVEVLWKNFEEEVLSDAVAHYGLDCNHPIVQEAFNKGIDVVFEVANTIQRYLVNTGYPSVEKKSIYASEKIDRDLLVLRLRTYNELITGQQR